MRGNEVKVGGLGLFGGGFQIPMRGNELTTLSVVAMQLSEFQIPMRGNEQQIGRVMRAFPGKFQIPMRGNEVGKRQGPVRNGLVSNPHEG